MTVDDFLDLKWRWDGARGEWMHFDGHAFRVLHVGMHEDPNAPSFTLAYMDGKHVGTATNMPRAVRLLYEHWKRGKSKAA